MCIRDRPEPLDVWRFEHAYAAFAPVHKGQQPFLIIKPKGRRGQADLACRFADGIQHAEFLQYFAIDGNVLDLKFALSDSMIVAREPIRVNRNLIGGKTDGEEYFDCISPVSYTHLDVYKRQVYFITKNTPIIRTNVSRLQDSIVSPGCPATAMKTSYIIKEI